MQAFLADSYACLCMQAFLANIYACLCMQAFFADSYACLCMQAFFADIYAEARKAKPGLGHRALAQVAGAHRLLRHYTMNIDGLAEAAGMDTWHVDNNPTGTLRPSLHTRSSVTKRKEAGMDTWHVDNNPTGILRHSSHTRSPAKTSA